MKRLVICLAASFALFAASAQSALELDVQRTKGSLDSLNSVLAETRNKYASNPDMREELTKQLMAMEAQALTLKQSYDKALKAYIGNQQRNYVRTATDSTLSLQYNQGEDTAAVATLPTYPKVANLVYNKLFQHYISAADLRTLREAQKQESVVQTKIKEYLRHYDRMVALKLEYERVDTEIAADSVLNLLEVVRKEASGVEAVIGDTWHTICDNKIYAYNLLMEQKDKVSVLTSADEELTKALRESEQVEKECESPLLSEYFYRKNALLSYECKVADVLELQTAQDSLIKVQRGLKKENYCLPKVKIVRRSFIEHEPIKVIKPTIYTTKNPIPNTRIYEYGTVYRIRIGIFTNRPNLSALKGVTPLSYTDKYHGGKYAYFVGGFRTEEEANEGVKQLVKLGFKSPQVVMWVDGEYISNIAEWKSKNLGFNIEITGIAALPDAVKAHISLRNENCRFSRVGTAFIVGTFASKSDAELVASEIVAMDSNIKAEVKSVK